MMKANKRILFFLMAVILVFQSSVMGFAKENSGNVNSAARGCGQNPGPKIN